ncbi:hypothetical protein K435DRAFT_793691 [Dendrothele bispora CBS 962.96]|uniref:Uncharacterized protein n=1 Tax=Dendrothele bispora (strain CBS 962.96) TaxID=1314807 RepID=A0A4S8MEF6_DENBC|nr:hypothetical protein K435DRAFT_793691 [Dendrothele bispora CBS 962.96]
MTLMSISASARLRKSRNFMALMGKSEDHQKEHLKRDISGSTFDNKKDQDKLEGYSIRRSRVGNWRGEGKHRAVEEYSDNGKRSLRRTGSGSDDELGTTGVNTSSLGDVRTKKSTSPTGRKK